MAGKFLLRYNGEGNLHEPQNHKALLAGKKLVKAAFYRCTFSTEAPFLYTTPPSTGGCGAKVDGTMVEAKLKDFGIAVNKLRFENSFVEGRNGHDTSYDQVYEVSLSLTVLNQSKTR